MTTRIVRGQGIFVDDGYPESDDYESSYVTYDPRDARDYARAVEEALRRMAQTAGPWPRRPRAAGAV